MIVGYVWLTGVTTCLLSWLALMVASVLARRALDRRRLRAWEAEWRSAGPLWRDHRS